MGVFFKFKKGSQAARDHMAKIRAMRGKKARKNPLTKGESATVMSRARQSAKASGMMKPQSFSHGFFAGTATGREEVVRDFGPGRKKNPRKRNSAAAAVCPLCSQRRLYPQDGGVCSICTMNERIRKGEFRKMKGLEKCPFCKIKSDIHPVHGCRSCGRGGRQHNPPLLIIGNPGGKRKFPSPSGAMLNDVCMDCGRQRATHYPGGPCASVRFERAYSRKARQQNPGRRRRAVSQKARSVSGGRFGAPPKGFPSRLWRDPAFQRELKVFRARHGQNVPVRITSTKIPQGYPKYMTAYGTASHAVYDTPKQSKRGKFIHHFGKKGKNRPFLVSSAARGPKWLGYAGGRFTARNKWLYD